MLTPNSESGAARRAWGQREMFVALGALRVAILDCGFINAIENGMMCPRGLTFELTGPLWRAGIWARLS